MGYRSGRRTLLPRETYSSLQTSRRYLRIRLGNKVHPAARDSRAKRRAFVPTTRSNGVPAVLNSLSDFAPVDATPDRGTTRDLGFPQVARATAVENISLILIPSDQL